MVATLGLIEVLDAEGIPDLEKPLWKIVHLAISRIEENVIPLLVDQPHAAGHVLQGDAELRLLAGELLHNRQPIPESNEQQHETQQITDDFLQKRLGGGVADDDKVIQAVKVIGNVDDAAEQEESEARNDKFPPALLANVERSPLHDEQANDHQHDQGTSYL